ncbi:gamma-glutamylcyclotransferase family protein [Bradyrhizobium sp. S69]|uniref:gamma-glutamylcyclotransferase family protein n=1 Tax=Bradyrhizobium sp. S69 TaxID=1641856 RepID=UPI00131B6A12|nr:gamma-glutamylcyclotransferase family protein [Bradyrhizobium sp. S69]
MSDERTVLLFSYGTLQQDEVQLSSFGRLLDGQEDAMVGYRQSLVEITEPEVIRTSGKRFHPIVEASDNPGDEVKGKVFRITDTELKAADDYEVADYKRIQVLLRSGNSAWVYVRA